MDIPLLLQGLLIGFSIAAPVGPIGVLCIRRTLADGRAVGVATGLGAASADAVFGSIAAFGLAFISSFLVQQQSWIRLLGGAFLCYLGIKTLLVRPAETAAQAKSNGLFGAYASTFFSDPDQPGKHCVIQCHFCGAGIVRWCGQCWRGDGPGWRDRAWLGGVVAATQ